jgi:two-component system cell cycle sensor histidine kinase PleC
MFSPSAEHVERKLSAQQEMKASRRRLQAVMRDMRERLTSDSGFNRSFEYELCRLFAKARHSSSIALTLFAVAVCGALCIWVPPFYALMWGMMVLGMTSLHFVLSRKFLGHEPESVDPAGWKRRFTLMEMMVSISWTSIVLFTQLGSGESLSTFVLFTLLLYAAVTAVLCSSVPAAVYAGLLPISIGMIIFARPGIDIDGTMLALMGSSGVLFFVLLANRLYATACDTIAHRAEKDNLIASLEEEQSKSIEARKRAEEANIAKSRFLATMSHELRTPLNAILGFSEVLKSELFGRHSNDQYRDYAKDIHSSGQHLLALINEILDLSRIEAGRYDLQEEPVDVAGVAEECCHLLSIRAKAKNQTIRQLIETGLPRLWADERAIRQIVLNLLSNAVKFTPQGGEVTLRVGWTMREGQKHGIYLSVSDNGPGIPENELQTVVSSFGRGAAAVKNADEGSGLGLPIVKGLVEQHGGRFKLESRVKVGTQVTVMFPATRVMQALAPVREKPQKPGRAVDRRRAA